MPSLFRYGASVISLCRFRYFVIAPSLFRYVALVILLSRLRYFVIVPSLFRYVAFVSSLWRLRYFVMASSLCRLLFRYGVFVFSLIRGEKTIKSGLQDAKQRGEKFRVQFFVISLFRLHNFAMSLSLFRYGAVAISLCRLRYFAFVMSPRNNEKTKWHKSATIKSLVYSSNF